MQSLPRYKAYSLSNFRDIPQMARLPESIKSDIEVVGHVLPFKTINFFVDRLIDWEQTPAEPLFALNFPQRDMLLPHHYEEMAVLLKSGTDSALARCTLKMADPSPYQPRKIWRRTRYNADRGRGGGGKNAIQLCSCRLGLGDGCAILEFGREDGLRT